jgi:hypothetical protein
VLLYRGFWGFTMRFLPCACKFEVAGWSACSVMLQVPLANEVLSEFILSEKCYVSIHLVLNSFRAMGIFSVARVCSGHIHICLCSLVHH